MSTIGDWLTKREMLSPGKEAVVDGDRRLSYAQLNQRVNQLARALRKLGLSHGDRVAMLSYNCLEYVEVIMAAAKLGLVLVPLNWRLAPAELVFILSDSQTDVLVFDPELAELAGQVNRQLPLRQLVTLGRKQVLGADAYEDILAVESAAEPVAASGVSLDSPHIIMYTSGTTGKPKGAILSQNGSFYNALNLQVALDFTSADRDLLVLPMFHIGGIGLFTLPMLYVGGTVIIQRTFEPGQTIKLLQTEDISLFFGVPAVFLFLAQHPDFKASGLDRLRVVMSGGAPLPQSLVISYKESGVTLRQGFGMSEASPSIATLEEELALAKAGSIGKPLMHLDVRIVDGDDNELPRGQVGELVMRGPNVMQGYWNRPEATAEAMRGGWFHSGDLAYQDAEGDLFIVDRKKDMFISGGENVYPSEVEDAIYEIGQVAEAAVIGIPDAKWGEVGCAVVALKEGMDMETGEVISHLQQRLAKYKIPKKVAFVEALPRNAAGKVLKTELRRLYA